MTPRHSLTPVQKPVQTFVRAERTSAPAPVLNALTAVLSALTAVQRVPMTVQRFRMTVLRVLTADQSFRTADPNAPTAVPNFRMIAQNAMTPVPCALMTVLSFRTADLSAMTPVLNFRTAVRMSVPGVSRRFARPELFATTCRQWVDCFPARFDRGCVETALPCVKLVGQRSCVYAFARFRRRPDHAPAAVRRVPARFPARYGGCMNNRPVFLCYPAKRHLRSMPVFPEDAL